MKLKVYYPPHLFDKNLRSSWFELVKSKERLERSNREFDQKVQSLLSWQDSPNNAEVWILPLDWNYYYLNDRKEEALAFCREADEKGIIVLSYTGGDQGITVPAPKNTIIYRQSGYRSILSENERTAPFFLSDPVGKFVKDEETLINKSVESKPIVGFCGMAPHGIKVEIKEKLQIVYGNIKNKLFDKQEVISSSNLRFKALEQFNNSDSFLPNYIIRPKYRGGEQTPENRKKTTIEYYNNQIESDLILCVRGVGNFSPRFSETLAMGCIPIFVDPDCPMPDIGGKDWNDYLIWIDKKDLKNASEIANRWLEGRDLNQQFKLNRELWKEHFRLDGFWRYEIERLRKTINLSKLRMEQK